MGVTINNKSTTTEPTFLNRLQPKPLGGLNAFYQYQIYILDSAVVEVQETISSNRSLLLQCIIMEKHFKQIQLPKALTKSPNRQLTFYEFALKLKWYDYSFLHHQIARSVYCKDRNCQAVRTRCPF